MSDNASTALRARSLATTIALPLAPLIVLFAFVFFDHISDDATEARQVQQAAAHLGTVLPFAALYLLFGILNVALVVRVTGAIRGRGSAWANLGAVVGILGSAAVMLGAARRAMFWVLLKSDPANAVAVMTKLDKSVYAVIVVLILGIPLGYLTLGIAAFRAGIAPWPVLAAMVLLVLSFMAAVNAAAAALGVIAFSWIAWQLRREALE